jgi:hypothetical protein
MGGINTISFSFINQEGRHMDIPEARRVIITLVDDMVTAINANSDLASFLVTFPFTEKQIDLTLMNNEKDNRWVFEPAIGGILFFEGDILYTISSKKREYVGKTIKEETYDEAVEILKKENEN